MPPVRSANCWRTERALTARLLPGAKLEKAIGYTVTRLERSSCTASENDSSLRESSPSVNSTSTLRPVAPSTRERYTAIAS